MINGYFLLVSLRKNKKRFLLYFFLKPLYYSCKNQMKGSFKDG
ncbi:hypothetical protein D920_01542 [Enterococcus faecalis 13-SD-W-01]|nr:hypothetical protein D920_01542 [Enterococcus faecalis 13-SD-W-01]